MTRQRATHALLLVGALCASCRSQPAPSASPASADSTSATPAAFDIITAQQIADANLLGNVASIVVQRLRPSYLVDGTPGARPSMRAILVSVNGEKLSALNALNAIPASTIAEIRYLTFRQAAQRFGNRNTGPVILVTLMSH